MPDNYGRLKRDTRHAACIDRLRRRRPARLFYQLLCFTLVALLTSLLSAGGAFWPVLPPPAPGGALTVLELQPVYGTWPDLGPATAPNAEAEEWYFQAMDGQPFDQGLRGKPSESFEDWENTFKSGNWDAEYSATGGSDPALNALSRQFSSTSPTSGVHDPVLDQTIARSVSTIS